MARKPNSMYRYVTGQAYTRREYMGGVPMTRITQFDHGNPSGKFPIAVTLVIEETCHLRHTALEAMRIAANRLLQKKCGTMNYYLKIRVFPHIILRENKQATGAGADRVSQGMRRSFGKAVGCAARVYSGQRIVTIRTTKAHFKAAKESLRRGGMKLPSPTRIVIEEGAELLA
jgi:large subunit ribosomal protein L10e